MIQQSMFFRLPTQIINQMLSLMCKMLTPDKADATRGRSQLAEILENIAYLMLTATECPTPDPPDL